jgi:hypothetical protein
MDASLVLERLRVFSAIDSSGVLQKMATRHMRGVTSIVTLLQASVSQGTGRNPLPAMFSTSEIPQAHPHKGVGF